MSSENPVLMSSNHVLYTESDPPLCVQKQGFRRKYRDLISSRMGSRGSLSWCCRMKSHGHSLSPPQYASFSFNFSAVPSLLLPFRMYACCTLRIAYTCFSRNSIPWFCPATLQVPVGLPPVEGADLAKVV